MVAYNVKELISILIRNGLLLYNTQIPVFSSKISCKRIRDAALSTFIHHYTFAAKSKSIKYDSRRTIRVGMETIPCTTQ